MRRSLTDEFSGLVGTFVDERFKCLFHGVDKLLVLHEADVDDVVHFVFEVQQLLNHRLVLLRVDNDRASKHLREGNVSVDFKASRMCLCSSSCSNHLDLQSQDDHKHKIENSHFP